MIDAKLQSRFTSFTFRLSLLFPLAKSTVRATRSARSSWRPREEETIWSEGGSGGAAAAVGVICKGRGNWTTAVHSRGGAHIRRSLHMPSHVGRRRRRLHRLVRLAAANNRSRGREKSQTFGRSLRRTRAYFSLKPSGHIFLCFLIAVVVVVLLLSDCSLYVLRPP